MSSRKRHTTVGVPVGRVQVGGGAPVVVQSMANTDTADVASTAKQCIELDRLSGPTDFTVAEVPLRVLEQGSGKAVDPWGRYRSVKQRVPASLTRDLAG